MPMVWLLILVQIASGVLNPRRLRLQFVPVSFTGHGKYWESSRSVCVGMVPGQWRLLWLECVRLTVTTRRCHENPVEQKWIIRPTHLVSMSFMLDRWVRWFAGRSDMNEAGML
jgi:hypothetical protein